MTKPLIPPSPSENDYDARAADEAPLPEEGDPMPCSTNGWQAAEKAEPNDPNAMALATATPTGPPAVRMVLLKDADAARLRLLHQPRQPQGRRARRQSPGRPAVPLENPAPPGPHRRAGRARDAGRSRRLFRHPRARFSRSAPGPRTSRAPWKDGSALEARVAEFGPHSASARCRGRRTGPAIAWSRRRWSSGTTGRSGCMSGWCSRGRTPIAPGPRAASFPEAYRIGARTQPAWAPVPAVAARAHAP